MLIKQELNTSIDRLKMEYLLHCIYVMSKLCKFVSCDLYTVLSVDRNYFDCTKCFENTLSTKNVVLGATNYYF